MYFTIIKSYRFMRTINLPKLFSGRSFHVLQIYLHIYLAEFINIQIYLIFFQVEVTILSGKIYNSPKLFITEVSKNSSGALIG